MKPNLALSVRSFVAAVTILAMLCSSALMGQSAFAAENEEEGKRRFLAGQQLYEQGKYLEAAKEFEIGYAAAPRPAFLLNIARAYHKAGELKKAKAHFDLLLQLAPEFEGREDIASEITQINDEQLAVRTDAARKKKAEEDAAKAAAAKAAADKAAADKAAAAKLAAAKAAKKDEDEDEDDDPAPVPTAPAGQGDFEFERRNVMTLEEEESKKQDEGGVLSSPWFWVATVAVVVGAGVAVALLAGGDKAGCTASLCLKEPI